jgi:hypothetical protein
MSVCTCHLGYALFVRDTGRPVFYIIQQRLQQCSIGATAQQAAPQAVTALFQSILTEPGKGLGLQPGPTRRQVGIDGRSQLGCVDFNPNSPNLSTDGPAHIDTQHAPDAAWRVEQCFDPSCSCAPPALPGLGPAPAVRRSVMTRHYDPRKVTIDLLAPTGARPSQFPTWSLPQIHPFSRGMNSI